MVRPIAIVPIISLFLSWQAHQVNGELIMAAFSAGQTAYDVYEAIRGFVSTLDTAVNGPDVPKNPHIEIFNKLESIHIDLRRFENNLFALWENEAFTKISKKIDSLEEDMKFIDDKYTHFHQLLNNRLIGDLWEYSKGVTMDQAKNTASDTVNRMHHNLAGRLSEGNLLHLIASKQDSHFMCLKRKTSQQILQELYHNVISADLKVLALKLYFIEGNKTEALETRSLKSKIELVSFNNRSRSSYEVVLKEMAVAQRILWACDPKITVNNEFPAGSYGKVPVFQKFLTTERDRRHRHTTQGYDCPLKTCSRLNNEDHPYLYEAHSKYSDYLEPKLRCYGQISQCEQTTWNNIKACVAPKEDERRYLGITYVDDGGAPQTRGDYYPQCENPRELVVRLFKLQRCLVCLCTCNSLNRELPRYFSLQPALSDTSDGMVVTGVRLMKHDRVFHIQIQQGRLKANGTIENTEKHAPQWVNVTKLDYDADSYKLKENDELFAVSYKSKKVLLDDFVADEGDFVLTGLQFKQIIYYNKEDQLTHNLLTLRVRVHSFDYKTGKLGEEKWLPETDKDSTIVRRKQISLEEADDPIKMARVESHKINTDTGTFIEFGVTSSKKDMGQTTVPFIDLQEVVTNPPVPLAGAGIYHKGTRSGDSGGFLGLKLSTYDLSKHPSI